MARTDWFIHDRFGMFIHWGLYSVPGGVWQGKKNTHPYSEWLQASEHISREEYRKLTEQFDPCDFDADEWIRTAKNAGMKYFMITAKHHDGFALWPSKVSTYNVMDETPFKRDILGELATACKKYDVKLGFYYSHWQDWEGTGGAVCAAYLANEEYRHPSQGQFEEYWQKKCLPQVRELIENYDPWSLWFDSWGDTTGSGDFLSPYITPERQDELIDLIRSLSDKCLINGRIQYLKPSERVDFLSMMDNQFPENGFPKPWETLGTLNKSFAYHSLDFDWKTTRQLIQNLVKNAALGGNYELNVGPMGDGCFEKAATRRLREIGAWMEVNGEAVYGTAGCKFGKQDWGRITCKGLADGRTRLYLHLWEFAPGDDLCLTGFSGEVVAARVIETRQPVQVKIRSGELRVEIPRELNREDMPVIALDVACPISAVCC